MRRLLQAALLGCVILASALSEQARARAFVDFHARPGPDIVGHAFIVYGHLDSRGRITSSQIAGLYTDEKYYLAGIVIPMHGVIGSEPDDLTTRSAVVYRQYLTDSQLRQLQLAVARVKALQHTWHFVFFNCNDFVGEIAETTGLHRPPSLLLPVSYVAALGAMNGLMRLDH